MDTSKIKIKLGQHEFEAEGPTEMVQSQFLAFKEMIAALTAEGIAATPSGSVNPAKTQREVEDETHVPLDKIMHVEGRVVSLTAKADSAGDAALLILLGQRDLRGNQSATGQEIGDGLAQSGQPANRVDRVLQDAIKENSVMKIGLGRSTRYRLTNQGLQRALGIARELVGQLP